MSGTDPADYAAGGITPLDQARPLIAEADTPEYVIPLRFAARYRKQWPGEDLDDLRD